MFASKASKSFIASILASMRVRCTRSWPNGSGKSTLSHVIAGQPGYEVTGGQILFKGEELLEMDTEERAAKGVFLAFQYPVEIPGVTTMTFCGRH
ncbi:Fe-S cluster assembly ATPase SufC [Bradyrhizobium ottawaense]